MKATGIARQVDELGRIVIPIELRRAMRINTHDPLEIYVENGRIVLEKVSDGTEELFALADKYATSLVKSLDLKDFSIIITDTDKVVSHAELSLPNFYKGEDISDQLKELIQENKTLVSSELYITSGDTAIGTSVVYPISKNDKVIGLVIVSYEHGNSMITTEFREQLIEKAKVFASFLNCILIQ